jgi:riboflavin biosynthesis pyrimidine reductase
LLFLSDESSFGFELLEELLPALGSPLKVAGLRAWNGRLQGRVGDMPGVQWLGADFVTVLEVLRFLRGAYQVEKVVFEAGGPACSALLELGAVGDLYLILSPCVVGGAGGMQLSGALNEFLPSSIKASLVSLEPFGEECVVHWRILGDESFSEKVDGASFGA